MPGSMREAIDPIPIRGGARLLPGAEIICSTTTNPPKPYLAALNAEIVDLNSSRVLVNYPNIGWTCYNTSSGGDDDDGEA